MLLLTKLGVEVALIFGSAPAGRLAHLWMRPDWTPLFVMSIARALRCFQNRTFDWILIVAVGRIVRSFAAQMMKVGGSGLFLLTPAGAALECWVPALFCRLKARSRLKCSI
jgi:hypothetical protein